MRTLTAIEKQAKEYSEARDTLAEKVKRYKAEIAEVDKIHLPVIRHIAGSVASKESALKRAIEAAKDFFKKPRTRIFSGIKVGFQKGKGKTDFDGGEEAVIARIKKHFPDKAKALIVVEESVNKKALSSLTAAELKKIGVTIEESGDHVFVKPADSDIDKFVRTVLDGAKKDKEEAA